MKNPLFGRRIPTIFGIGIVVLGIVLTTIIVRVQTSLKSSASNSQQPQNVKITNLSDNSFTITYKTDVATTGSVSYGSSKQLGNIQLEGPDSKNVHSITVEKLFPLTKYYLVIISGQNTFLNNGIPFEISTGPKLISSPSALETLKGKVVLPDGSAPSGALIYLSENNSQLLSTITAKNGEFNLSLEKLRTDDLLSYFEFNEDTILKLEALNNSLKSTVLFSLNQTGLLPTIALSNDYDFTKDYIPIASESAQAGFPSIAFKSTNSKPQILTPKKDQAFTDQRPQFQGTSLPNETVEIIIHSDENIQTQVTADSNGNWTYRPPANLSSGIHTITIKTRDSSGILTTIIQSFTVLATQAPTPTPIIIIPTSPLAFEPSPTFMPIESKGGLPPTGDSSVLLIIGGIVTTISGIALFLLTRTIL